MLAKIQIHSQMGTLAIQTQNARLDGGPAKRRISVRGNNGARIQMHTTHARVQIDQTRSRDSAGITPILESNLRFDAKSYQKGLQRIGGIAREGLAIMKIENGGGGGTQGMARIAANKGYKDARLTMRAVTPPKISATMGSVEISDVSAKPEISSHETASTSRYIPGTVQITWGREPSIEITVIPGAELSFPNARGVGMNMDTST
jgi:hypothetical protein